MSSTSQLHVVNSYFEEEMTRGPFPSPSLVISNHFIYRKLQWLAFLYGKEGDGVMVTEPPPQILFSHFPKFTLPECHLFSEKAPLSYQSLAFWGAAPSVATWAKKQGLICQMPSWDCVRFVNSKQFSFSHSPKLPGSALLYTLEEVDAWAAKQPGPSVLKTCFGFSGRGHLHLPEHAERIHTFTRAEFKESRPVIGEPWVNRIMDFSTQWEILQPGEIRYLGMTQCINDAKGRYKETCVGNGSLPLHFQEHLEMAMFFLEEMKKMGYFGNVGMDAMIYEDGEGKQHLHPIVEINARKTMGWVALKIRERHFPNQSIKISFSLTKKDFAVILTPWSS